jgi:RNA polymerase sigma-70 factor, ECF subfamily
MRMLSRETSDVSDAELARSVRTGSLDALGELYGRYADDVYTTALRLVGSEADAEDVLQDVFVGLPLAMSRYEERGAFGPWLRRVAARTALMRLRRAENSASPGRPSAEAAAPARDPVVRVAAGRAIAGLPASLRAVFVLKEVEGYSHDEIGALLDITPGASALRLHRAWKLLRKQVG